MIELKKMTIQDAKHICCWRYEDEYSVYNLPEWKVAKEDGYDITKSDKRESEFMSIYLNNELMGYGRISLRDNQVVLGIGIKPDQCSKGYGNKAFKLLIQEAKTRSNDESIVLIVRSFNERAIKCYKKNHFIIINELDLNNQGESVKFTKMLYVNR